jgi:F0F1-type ATP synthase assembly protein I
MTNYFQDFVIMTGTAMVFFVLSWSSARAIQAGKPLPPHIRRMLVYSFLFVLGTAYIMMVVSWLHWPPRAIVGPIIAWGSLLGYIAWQRHQRTKVASMIPRKPISSALAEALPVIGLLVLLILSLIAWSVWTEGGARLWVPLACTAGSALTIFLTRRNRRSTVIMALRGLVGLGVVGALSHPTGTAFITVGLIGLVLVLLERFWKDGQTPPHEQQVQALFDRDNPASTTKSH